MTLWNWLSLLGGYLSFGLFVTLARISFIHSRRHVYEQQGLKLVVQYPDFFGIVAFWPAVLILWALIWVLSREVNNGKECD